MKIDNKRQQVLVLPEDKARTKLVELMHEGFDTYCSEIDSDGDLTIVWPASTNVGKQLPNG